MDGSVMAEAFVNVARWGLEHRLRKLRRRPEDTSSEGSVRA
jgi:hypothetical protein